MLLAGCSEARPSHDAAALDASFADARVQTDAARHGDHDDHSDHDDDAAINPRTPAMSNAGARAATEDAGDDDAGTSAAHGGAAWHSLRASLDATGTTDTLTWQLPSGTGAFAVRVSADASALRCFQLQNVVVNGASTWVDTAGTADYGDYCTTCSQRVSAQTSYGLYVLPSGEYDGAPLRSVSVRAALRDCVTLTPLSAADMLPATLTLELASWRLPSPQQRLRLPLAVVVASQVGFANDDSLLDDALAHVQQIWAAADIDVALEPRVVITPPDGALEYAADDITALAELGQRARAALGNTTRSPAWPIAIFGPCLRRIDVVTRGQSEPWAFTPHLPGGSSVGGAPDQIVIAVERCEGLEAAPSFSDAALLGAVIAHELGHYLGLYHVAEADGRQDALQDTTDTDLNLMRATPSATSTALSATQIAITRRHNAFAASPLLQP